MKMNKNKIKGFTLVELLAVIVILAVILVIAVPQIMETIKDTTRASFESSAKMVAAQVENQYTVSKTLSKEFGTTGDCMKDWAGLNDTDYEACTYTIESDGTAKITLVGKGKFKGLKVEDGTRNRAIAVEDNTEALLPIEWYAGSDVSELVSVKDAEGNIMYYKISDYAESIDKLEGVVTEFSDGIESMVLTLSTESEEFLSQLIPVDENSYVFSEGIIIINQISNNVIDGIIFPEPGTYLIADAIEALSFSIGGRLKPTVVIEENSIKWDGNTIGLECVEATVGTFCKVFDTIPSTNVESYKKLIAYDNDKYLEYDGEGIFVGDGTSINLAFFGLVVFEDSNDFSKGVWFYWGSEDSYTTEIQFE